jgi:hypothetical protein
MYRHASVGVVRLEAPFELECLALRTYRASVLIARRIKPSVQFYECGRPRLKTDLAATRGAEGRAFSVEVSLSTALKAACHRTWYLSNFDAPQLIEFKETLSPLHPSFIHHL